MAQWGCGMNNVPKWLDQNYINWSGLLSYGAPFNFLDATRDRGKTWGILTSAYKRAKRKHKGTILVRRTHEATKASKRGAIKNKWCKHVGVSRDDVRIRGDYAEYKDKNGKWHPYIWFVTLSDHSNLRSGDDDYFDRMILDEGKVSARMRAMYHGDEVNDLMDLYHSLRREENMQVLILGNRESVSSPYMRFFGIEPLPMDFNGVKRFRNGTVICAQSTRAPDVVNDFDAKVRTALEGTKYGDFAYKGIARDFDTVHVRKRPKTAKFYASFDFGIPLTAWSYKDAIYFTSGIDKTRTIFVNKMGTQYQKSIVYTQSEKSRFYYLARIKRENGIYYDDVSIAEDVLKLISEIGI